VQVILRVANTSRAIKRVIFESTIKSNGLNYVPLEISEIKQIAGRAGRYKTAHQAVNDNSQKTIAGAAADSAIGLEDKPENKAPETKTVGWVTTLDQVDHDSLRLGMKREPDPIKTAGLFPPSLIVERFANYFPPGTPFSYIMLRLHEISEIHPRFHLCALKDQLSIADCIHPIGNLSIQDRITICAAPINMRNTPERLFLYSLARCIAEGNSGKLLDLDTLPLNVMDEPAVRGRTYLYKLENLHKMLVCYLWLSYRFPNVLTSRKVANYAKKLVEDQIEKTLTAFSFTESSRVKIRKLREKARKNMDEQGEGDDAQQLEGKIDPPPGMPSEAKDIVNDTRALHETAPPPDDENEYPEDPVSNSQVPEFERARAP
jgi:ATP-dependent RNA helicase SUPV3L1/SUV3